MNPKHPHPKIEQTWLLSGDALALALESQVLVQEFQEKCQAIEQEAQRQVRELEAAAKMAHLETWNQILDSLGLDKTAYYGLELAYFDEHGQAFLQRYQNENQPTDISDDPLGIAEAAGHTEH